jgi:hypothetical protein
LRTMHGEETIDNELSGYYLAGNITRTYDGMMIALPESEWVAFQTMPLPKLAEIGCNPPSAPVYATCAVKLSSLAARQG